MSKGRERLEAKSKRGGGNTAFISSETLVGVQYGKKHEKARGGVGEEKRERGSRVGIEALKRRT